MNTSELLAFQHEVADVADVMTLQAFEQAMDVERKADGTFVTETDRSVERMIRARIEETFPDHVILGEEFGGEVDAERPTWLVDPIDGTNNFVSTNPIYATLLAVTLGATSVAVVSAPALHARWDGVVSPEGNQARRNGRPIHVSSRGLAQGQVSFGGLTYFDRGPFAGLVTSLTAATRRQRGFGDFWQHCLVAEGSVEVAVEAAVSAWDLAAVRCLVTAAGGRFTDLHGRDTIQGGTALSTNGVVHDEVLRLAGAVDS